MSPKPAIRYQGGAYDSGIDFIFLLAISPLEYR